MKLPFRIENTDSSNSQQVKPRTTKIPFDPSHDDTARSPRRLADLDLERPVHVSVSHSPPESPLFSSCALQPLPELPLLDLDIFNVILQPVLFTL